MATFTGNYPFTAHNQSVFQQFVQGIRLAITSSGMEYVPVSGALNPNNVPYGAGLAPYEVYRFNDGLQAVAPVFLRISYFWVGGGSLTNGLRFQVGTSIDISGSFTGLSSDVFSTGLSSTGFLASDVAPVYASGDGSYLTLSYANRRNDNISLSPGSGLFFIERTTDQNLNYTTQGVIFGALPQHIGNASLSEDPQTGEASVLLFSGDIRNYSLARIAVGGSRRRVRWGFPPQFIGKTIELSRNYPILPLVIFNNGELYSPVSIIAYPNTLLGNASAVQVQSIGGKTINYIHPTQGNVTTETIIWNETPFVGICMRFE